MTSSIGALLGAEEYGFATAPLVVSGCIMMRVCHLDTCPVGIATQKPELRAKFSGKPEFVVTFFEYIAEEVREHLASLGLAFVGRGDRPRRSARHRRGGLALEGRRTRPLLRAGRARRGARRERRQTQLQDHGLEKALDHQFLGGCAPALDVADDARLGLAAHHERRPHGRDAARLGHLPRYGGAGLPEDTISLTFDRLGGPELRCLRAPGRDHAAVGRRQRLLRQGALAAGGWSCGRQKGSPFVAEDQIIAGNVILYGATAGEVFIRGQVGERFCVRNSGATAVVEGVGDHGCEYMTGGLVVVLGPTGRNFAAGMSGGVAYVYDRDRAFVGRVNDTDVDVEPLDAEDRSRGARRWWPSATAERPDHPSAPALLDRWATEVKRVRQGHAARLPAHPRGDAARPRPRGARSTRQ